MDKFVVRYSSSEEALPRTWKENALRKASPKRPIGRPKKRAREEECDVKENEPAAKRHEIGDPDQERGDAYKNYDVRRGHYERVTLKQKEEVVNFSKLHGIRVTARHLKKTKSTIANWSKIDFSQQLNEWGNLARSGRPVSYGNELDGKIAKWVLIQRDLQIPVSVDTICAYAKESVSREHPEIEFRASRNLATGFLKRHNLVLRSRTTMAQRLPEDLEEKLKLFHEFIKARREEDDFEDKMIINMDETPMYFDLICV